MKILHIADLHFQRGPSYKFVQDALFDAMRKSLDSEKIDLCVFSGDLLCKFDGTYSDVFGYLRSELILPLKIEKLVIACGNHDMNRAKIKPMFKNYLSMITSNKELNSFVEENRSEEFTENISHLEDYNQIIEKEIKPILHTKLSYIDEMSISGKRIALISLNTAWNAFSSSKDYGELLFPSTYIFDAVKSTKEFDFRIAVSHYPLSYLKEFNRIEIEDHLNRNIHCIFLGHSHRINKSVNYHSFEGVFSCIAPSCLCSNDAQHVGYVLFDIDLDTYAIACSEYRYVDGHVLFDSKGTIQLPVSEEKKDSIDIRKALRNKYKVMLDFATKRFILYDIPSFDFQKMFTDPVLKYHDEVRDIANVNTSEKKPRDSRKIPYRDLLNGKNHIIWGSEKSGKTTILLKLFLDSLADFDSWGSVPIYIDLKQYYKSNTIGKKLSLKQLIRDDYNLSNRLAGTLIAKHHIILLLDNYDDSKDAINQQLIDTLKECRSISVILSCRKDFEVSTRPLALPLEREELHIHGINRKQIRSLAEKWPSARSYNKEEVIDKIVHIFTQLNIGFNYWTVSLFLWIFDRTTDINIHNNVELIDLYIENLLEKPNLAMSLSKDFSFENYKDLLASLAFSFYAEREQTEYAMPYSELVNCFEQFKARNIRVIADSKTVLDYIIEKGIICTIGNNLYTFRLNGVFEYFLAHYMRINEEFRKRIISNETLFLSFGNELEMYSGFSRNDAEILEHIYLNTLSALELYFKRYPTYKDISPEVGHNPKLLVELSEMVANNAERITPLDPEKKDEVNDLLQPISEIESAVRVKERYSLDQISTDILSRHVFILSRVFRNMDALGDDKLINEIFNFIIDQGCLIFYFFLKDLKNTVEENPADEELLNFLGDFSPLISHSYIYEAVGHKNLRNLIWKRIHELKESNNPNIYKLFILYFMLIEANIQDSLVALDEIISIVGKNKFILESIMLKLIYYIVFMCDNKSLESELRDRVLKINRILKPEDRSARIVQFIDKTKLEQTRRQ